MTELSPTARQKNAQLGMDELQLANTAADYTRAQVAIGESCHSVDALSPSLLEHLLQVEGRGGGAE